MPCLQNEEFTTVNDLIHERLNELSRQTSYSAFQDRKRLLHVRDKLISLKCSKIAKYAD